MTSNTAQTVRTQTTKTEQQGNPLSGARLSVAPQQSVQSAPKAALNDLSVSFGSKTRDALKAEAKAEVKTVTKTTVTTERRTVVQKEQRKTATRTRTNSATPVTVLDRFVTWLATALKNLVDRFTAKLPAFGFLKPLTTLVKKKHTAAEEVSEEPQEEQHEERRADKQAQEGPGVK